MIWFPASKFLIFSVLLAANPATAEEFQIHQPRTMVSAEHTTVATDIGQTTGLRSPISKAPAHWNPSEILPSRFHATYSLDLPCYHEDRNKWFGLEGSHCMIGNPKEADVLIAYATGEGQTQKIAHFIGGSLEHRGIKVDYLNTNEPHEKDIPCTKYRGIILGSSLRNRHYADSIGEFIRQHKPDLERVPSAFYSVSMGDIKGWRHGVKWCIDGFLGKHKWQPKLIGRFGGALKYTQYENKWMKWGMSCGAAIIGHPTDTSRDHELTDWNDVTRFADQFVAML